MLSSGTFFLAFIGGLLPALVWLWFWLREDRVSPEPRDLIIATFFAGMASVVVAWLLQKLFQNIFNLEISNNLAGLSVIPLVVWASIEEVVKFLAAYFVALTRRENDEPLDNMIYIITAAIGFAALENALFLIQPISESNFIHSIVTGNLRFIGTAPLHIVSSSIIGIMLALSFCKLPSIRRLYIFFGLILAIALHSLFNLSILNGGGSFIGAFGIVWIGVIVLLLFFEKVKRINKSCVYD